MLERANLPQTLPNGFGRIVWLRSQLKDVQPPSVEIDAVGEGSACINCYAQARDSSAICSSNSMPGLPVNRPDIAKS